MTSYAFVAAPLGCPRCGNPVADELWIQWGYCRGSGRDPASMYEIGSRIRWMACEGRVSSWAYLTVDSANIGGNFGDPLVLDLIVRDSAQYWLRGTCPRCGMQWDGGAVEIIGGHIARAWLVVPGEFATSADYWLLQDGLKQEAEWQEPSMALIDCRSPTVVET